MNSEISLVKARPYFWARYLPILSPVLLFGIMVSLYLLGKVEEYELIIRYYGVRPYAFPFGDADAIVSALECLRQGVDVIAANPCDSLDRTFNYSPVWLWLAIFPVTTGWLDGVGFATDLAFLAALALVPFRKDLRTALVMTAATMSTAVFFGLERANNDLIMFVLAALAASLLARSWRARIAGYAVLLLAGLLKYYPLVAMAVALRERTFRFLGVLAVSVALAGAVTVVTWEDLVRVLQLIPHGSPLDDFFGSATVGLVIADELHLSPTFARYIQLPMVALGIGLAVRLGLQDRTRAALATITDAERWFLLVGALLICGCFFMGQSIGYRAIHLVFVLPALWVMRRCGPERRFAHAPWWLLAAMWHKLWRQNMVGAGQELGGKLGHDGMQYLACAIREVFWWSLIVVLLGYIVSFMVHSPVGRELLAQLRERGSVVAIGGQSA